MNDWQPIETAPKDNLIIGYDPVKENPIQVMKYDYGGWGDAVYQEWSAEPTHWMPLPEPPKQPDTESPHSSL